MLGSGGAGPKNAGRAIEGVGGGGRVLVSVSFVFACRARVEGVEGGSMRPAVCVGGGCGRGVLGAAGARGWRGNGKVKLGDGGGELGELVLSRGAV